MSDTEAGWERVTAPSSSIVPAHGEALSENGAVERDASSEQEITELTEEEEWAIEQAREMDNPVVVEMLGVDIDGTHTLDEDDYEFVEKAAYEQQEARVQAVREALEQGLIEHGALSEPAVEQLSIDALWRESEKIDDAEPERLTQEPETGGVEALDSDSTQSTGDRDEIASLLGRARSLSVAAPERAAELREKAESLAGVEDYEDIDIEVL